MAEAQPAPKTKTKRFRKLKWLLGAIVVLLGVAGYFSYRYIYCFYSNFHTVVEGQVYRSARPNAARLHEWVNKYGIKTVIDLEGEDDRDVYGKENRLEMAELGVEEIELKLASGRLPTSQQVREIIEVLETKPRPILIHCRVGAERTGLGSVIAAMAVGGQDYKTARKQLSAQYLHVYHGADRAEGVVDEYEKYCSSHGLDTAGWEQFRKWAMTEYGTETSKPASAPAAGNR